MKLVYLAAIFATIGLSGCASSEMAWQSTEGATWGTEYHIKYMADRDLSDTIVATMRRVELSLSPFEKASVITAINAGKSDVVDDAIERVFAESQRVNKISGGMFDPTVAPLINLWGFGYKQGVDSMPPADTIAAFLDRVGIAQCSIVDGKIRKKHPLTEFNFSAITKGMGCDEVADALVRNGATDVMVEIGGEVVVRGKNQQGQPWRIAVDTPEEADKHQGIATVAVSDCALATSGNYRRFRTDLGEKPVGHTISPVTGYPCEQHILSATVIAPTCMTADALATACMTMTPEAALAMIEREPGAEVLLIVAAPAGSPNPLATLTSSGFPPLK